MWRFVGTSEHWWGTMIETSSESLSRPSVGATNQDNPTSKLLLGCNPAWIPAPHTGQLWGVWGGRGGPSCFKITYVKKRFGLAVLAHAGNQMKTTSNREKSRKGTTRMGGGRIQALWDVFPPQKQREAALRLCHLTRDANPACFSSTFRFKVKPQGLFTH